MHGLMAFWRYHCQVNWWTDEWCEDWQGEIARAVVKGSGLLSGLCMRQLMDPKEKGGFGLMKLTEVRDKVIGEVTGFRRWDGHIGQVMADLREWARSHEFAFGAGDHEGQACNWLQWWGMEKRKVKLVPVEGKAASCTR